MSTLAKHLNQPYGYSCQCWLAVDIANRFFNYTYRAWFSTELNPVGNGFSSNPLVIFEDLDKVVKTNDFNHGRVDQLKTRLCNWVLGSSLSPVRTANLISEIMSAPMPALRPQLWKIDLSNIHVSRIVNLGQFYNEYQLRDLVRQEIEVIAQ